MKIEFFQSEGKLCLDALKSGVYLIAIGTNGKFANLYIGESNYILKRCATHLSTIKKEPEKFGIDSEWLKDDNIVLRFKTLDTFEDHNGFFKSKEKKERKTAEQKRLKKGTLLQNSSSDKITAKDKVFIVKAALENMQK